MQRRARYFDLVVKGARLYSRLMPGRSITRVKSMRRALPPSELNVRIARLAVLYEDLRLEFYAAAEPEIKVLESIGDTYRRLYFLRRAILTTLEIRGAFQRLDQLPEFRSVKSAFSKVQLAAWNVSVAFLATHDANLRGIRDDVGGHFMESAARYALENMSGAEVGILTIQEGSEGDTAGPILKFAGTIVAVGMIRHRGQQDPRTFFSDTLKLLKECLGHITRQVHILSYYYLWPRFGA